MRVELRSHIDQPHAFLGRLLREYFAVSDRRRKTKCLGRISVLEENRPWQGE